MRKRNESSRILRACRSNNVIYAAAGLVAMQMLASSARAALGPALYQWNFDGANPGSPNVSAGGGTLSVTNSTNGGVLFNPTGGVGGGGMLDLHTQQYNTADPSGYASSEVTGNALTGLGAMGQITVSMWVKASGTGNALSANSFPALLELADIPNYDKDNNNPSATTTTGNNNGITLQLNGGASTQNYTTWVRGQTNGSSTLGPSLAPDVWTLVVYSLDSAFDGTNNNPYFDPKMNTATGGQLSGNQVLYTATATSLAAGFSGSATDNSFNAYPGTINFGSSAQIYLGNRGTGTPPNPSATSGDNGGAVRGFSGDIDDVRIYGGLAGPNEVEQIRRADLGLPANLSSQWTAPGDGAWLDGTNWQQGPPTIINDAATFGALGGTGPHNVTLNNTVSVGTVTFGDASSPSGNYTIGGTGVIVLSNTDSGSLSTITVLSGNQTINAQLNAGTFATHPVSPVFNIAAGASLTVTNFVTFNAGPNNGVVKTGPGKLVLPSFSFGNLNVLGGTLQILPGVTSGGNFFKPYSLNIANGASLDLANNNFVIAAGDTNLSTVQAQVATAYAGGSWTGTSATSGAITSANAAAAAANASNHFKTGVGFAVAFSLTSAWIGGANPGGSNVLLSYTLLGDSDLNGSVDSSDFTALSQNFNQSGMSWVNGDFNYDGVVNALDFNILASNFGAPLSAPALGALVPEPASLLFGIGGLMLLGRRRVRRID